MFSCFSNHVPTEDEIASLYALINENIDACSSIQYAIRNNGCNTAEYKRVYKVAAYVCSHNKGYNASQRADLYKLSLLWKELRRCIK